MGRNNYRQFNAVHKAQAGWLTPRTVTANGTYTITALESSTGDRLLKVPLPGFPFEVFGAEAPPYYTPALYLDYRKTAGVFDGFPATAPAVRGVGLRLAANWTVGPGNDDFYETQLLDTRPNPGGFGDAPLPVGGYFVDPYRRVSVYVTSRTTDTVTVQICVTGCSSRPDDSAAIDDTYSVPPYASGGSTRTTVSYPQETQYTARVDSGTMTVTRGYYYRTQSCLGVYDVDDPSETHYCVENRLDTRGTVGTAYLQPGVAQITLPRPAFGTSLDGGVGNVCGYNVLYVWQNHAWVQVGRSYTALTECSLALAGQP